MKETVPKFAKLFEKYIEEFSPKESKFIVGEEVSIFHHLRWYWPSSKAGQEILIP